MLIAPHTFLAFAATAAAIAVTPGPTAMLLVSYGLALGPGGARVTVPAVVVGDLTAMALSLLGLGAVLAASADVFTVLKWLGAAYLIVLGIRMWKAKPAPTDTSAPRGRSRSAIFRHVYVVTALNPKSIAFYVALLPQFVDPARPAPPQLAALAFAWLAIGTVNALAYALLAGRLRMLVASAGARRWLDRAAGSCLIGAGAWLGLAPRG